MSALHEEDDALWPVHHPSHLELDRIVKAQAGSGRPFFHQLAFTMPSYCPAQPSSDARGPLLAKRQARERSTLFPFSYSTSFRFESEAKQSRVGKHFLEIKNINCMQCPLNQKRLPGVASRWQHVVPQSMPNVRCVCTNLHGVYNCKRATLSVVDKVSPQGVSINTIPITQHYYMMRSYEITTSPPTEHLSTLPPPRSGRQHLRRMNPRTTHAGRSFVPREPQVPTATTIVFGPEAYQHAGYVRRAHQVGTLFHPCQQLAVLGSQPLLLGRRLPHWQA